MIRKILSIISGYAIFVITSLAFFKLSGQDPHGDTGLGFQIATATYGLIVAAMSGWVVQTISRSNSLALNFVLAFIIAGFATFSLIKAEGSHWTQLMAIFLFAPASVLGGWLCLRKVSRQAN